MSDNPFSYTVVANDIPAKGRQYRFEMDEAQRRAVAETLGVPEVQAFVGDFEVRPLRGHSYSVRGKVEATVVQTCVVTLDPFPQEVAEEVDVTLMRAEDLDPASRGKEALVDAVETEGPEVFHRGRIDLGVIATEHLALGLDPYPRAPGADFGGHIEDDSEVRPSPFAGLADLKARKP
jgi:uncharacterized metal-binding protein YceD (DUF177 family)